MTATSDKIIKEAFPEVFKASSKNESKTEYIADFPDLVDLVWDEDDKRVKFLLFDGSASETVILQDKTYHCPQKNQLPPNMQIPGLNEVLKHAREHGVTGVTGSGTIFPPRPQLCKKCQDLYVKLYKLHQSISELPDPGFYHVLALWDFHTHCQEKSEYSPIIYFYSVAERGKTRTMKGMVSVSRRGIRKGDIKDAQLIRDCTHLKASLAFDMTDFWESVSTAGSKDVILNRYERGLTVSRVNRPERGPFQDTDFYDVFGPTILATNEIIGEIADTRAIPITMVRATRDFEDEVRPKDLLAFNEELVAWRMVHLQEEWEQPKKILRSRLGDIVRPLHQILLRVAPQFEEEFTEIIKKVSATKLTEKSSSITAEILVAINKAVATGNIVSGVIPSQVVTNVVNENKDDKEKLKSRKVGNIVKSLGFKPTQTSNNTLGFIYQEDLMTRLLAEYGVLTYPCPVTPVNPVSPTPEIDQTQSEDLVASWMEYAGVAPEQDGAFSKSPESTPLTEPETSDTL